MAGTKFCPTFRTGLVCPSRNAHWFHAEAFDDFAFFAFHGESSGLSLLESRTFASQVVCLRYGARRWSLAEAMLPTAC